MSTINRHPNTSNRRAEFREMHDPAPFVLHFHFLFRITALEKNIDMWQHIERDRVRIYLRRWLSILSATGRTRRGERCGFYLLFQFVDSTLAASGNGLIASRENAAYTKHPVQRINRHQRNRRRAVWIRDQTAMLTHIFAVDFRNDERNVGVHPEYRRIIDDNRARVTSDRHKFAGNLAAGAEKCDVDLVEGILAELLNCDFSIAKPN